jgi:GR25 family glycosyltransferase involved in LPS biosynthesis
MPPTKGTTGQLKGFDIFNTPVHVINLKERPDRWEHFLVKNAPAVDLLDLHRFNAINGKRVDFLKDPRISPQTRLNIMRNDRRSHREIATLGAIGASLSHSAVWRKLVDSGDPFWVIMEDDARFDVETLRRINEVAVTIPADAGVWLLGLYKPNHIREPLGSAWSRVHQFTALHAYVITRAAAIKFLEQMFPIESHVDHYMSAMSVLYDIPLVEHAAVHIPFGGVVQKTNKSRAVESNTSQHKKDGCSACHVPDLLYKYFDHVGPKTKRGQVVHGLKRGAPDRRILTYKAVGLPALRKAVALDAEAEGRKTRRRHRH